MIFTFIEYILIAFNGAVKKRKWNWSRAKKKPKLIDAREAKLSIIVARSDITPQRRSTIGATTLPSPTISADAS